MFVAFTLSILYYFHPADRGRAEPVRADVAVGALLGRRIRLPLHHLPRQLGELFEEIDFYFDELVGDSFNEG